MFWIRNDEKCFRSEADPVFIDEAVRSGIVSFDSFLGGEDAIDGRFGRDAHPVDEDDGGGRCRLNEEPFVEARYC